jgi:hypothetical protein
MNGQFLENQNVKVLVAPVDMNTAAITGARCDMGKTAKVCAIISMGASVAASVVLNFKQHNAAAAGTSKALSVVPTYYKKVGTATVFTKVEGPAAVSSLDLSADFAADGGVVAVEIRSDLLDTNGGFSHFSIDLDDSGAAKLVSGLYVANEPSHLPAYAQTL